MDSQDQNVPATSNAPPSFPPNASPLTAAQVPTYSAQHVQIDGDITAVPQEQVGFDGAQIIPSPSDRLTPPAEVFAEPALEEKQPLATPPAEDASLPDSREPTPGVPPAAEKTPLEILEEILASANEGGEDGSAPLNEEQQQRLQENQAKDKAEQEAREAAARAAEEARYQQEVDQRISLAQQDLQAAAQQREQISEQLQSEGKQVGPVQEQPEDQAQAIHQLQHDTLSQSHQ